MSGAVQYSYEYQSSLVIHNAVVMSLHQMMQSLILRTFRPLVRYIYIALRWSTYVIVYETCTYTSKNRKSHA